MRSLQSLMNLISVALASVVVILLLGFVFILMLVVFPFVFIWTLFSSRKHFDEDIVAEFDRVYQAMTDGELTKLDELKKEIPDLPHGTDRFLERHWLTNAIDAGNLNAVAWVLDHGVEINFHEDDGISPLGSAIQGENLSIVQLLIDRGADVNLPGTLDVTPLHVAAALGAEAIGRA
ncbi:MAG: ankyrin repeat domain-containing protein, partial [Boseongicola sp.]|nr:ankyrin repeat domain-containing protein [Boseongicola sp.]